MKIPLCLISRCFAAAAFSPVPRLSPAAGEPAIGLLDAPQVGFPMRDHIQRVALTMVPVVLLCLSTKAAGFEAYYTRLDRSLKGNAGKYSGIRMFANPIEELNTLHDGTPLALTGRTATKELPVTLDVDGQLADIRVTIRNGDAAKTTLSFGRNAVTYDFVSETLDDVPAPLTDGVLKLRVLVDRPMFDVVVNDGQCYLTAGRQPHALGTVSVKTEGGGVTVESLAVIKMKSIWKK